VTDAEGHPIAGSPRAAVVAGTLPAFVVAVKLIGAVRLDLLLDADLSWALPRLALGLLVVLATAAVGGVCAALFFLWSRSSSAAADLEPLPLSPRAAALLAAVAVAAGALLRLASLDRLPEVLWIDDVSLISPAFALKGGPSDFADAIRPAPYGVPTPFGTVGVLYLAGYRLILELAGVSVWGVRLPSALAGVVSLGTAFLLGRRLLPTGGAAFVALVLAGMRWHLILSRWSWQAVVLAPIVDIATLFLLRARGRASLAASAGAGLLVGIGAHVYLSAWTAMAALAGFMVWPRAGGEERATPRLAFLFAAGFLAAAAPLFLLREARVAPYFTRAADHNVLDEIRYAKSLLPVFSAAADAVAGPWFVSDPSARNDLPGRSRLGWILGVPFAAALARSLVRPRESLSALLLSHAAAALAASVAGGQALNPNGYRFAYLTTPGALAIASGALWLIQVLPLSFRRLAAIATVGLLAFSAAAAARDTLLRWAQARETFDGFHGQDTLLARSAARWEKFGSVELAKGLGFSPITIGAIRRYRLDPEQGRQASGSVSAARPRRFRIVAPDSLPATGERVVEHVRDDWARSWAVVLGECPTIFRRGTLRSPASPGASVNAPIIPPAGTPIPPGAGRRTGRIRRGLEWPSRP